MTLPRYRALVLSLVALVACDTGSGTFGVGGSQNSAKLRLINATGGPLDVASGGRVVSGGANVVSGASSACVTIDATTPALSVRQTGSSSDLPGLTATFTAGGSFTIIAFPSSNGTTQFATLPSSFTTASGQAGLRVFNGAPGTGSFDVYVTAPGATLVTPNAPNVGFGSASVFFNVSAGTDQIRFTVPTTTTVAFDAGNHSFTAGKSEIFVLASPTGALTGIVVPVC